ncbi:MAG: glycosyltransferase family 4 protein [Acidobacteriota bacterium]|nr:glycosyltransferase family 4 protein [Acidobacteriota bacterium]
MRICYFADGRSVHTKRWIGYFAQRGHEMHLISFKPMEPEHVAEMEEIGVRCHGHVGDFHLKKFWLTWKDLQKVRRVLKREKIDILHSHFLGTSAWFGTLSFFKPHIVTVMGGDVKGETWQPNANIQERMLTPMALEKADAVTVWSNNIGKIVSRYRTKKPVFETVHGGIDLQRFTPAAEKPKYILERLNIPAGKPVIFSPRIVRRLYNIDRIARAAGLVCDKLPDTYFIIALPTIILDEEYTEEIKKIFAENAARDRVRYVSTIPHDEIADYFRAADVTVSIPVTDGTPMSVLESMACATPAVIGDLPDYDADYFENEKTVLTVDVDNPQAVADAVLRYLNEPDFAAQIAGEALRRVRESASRDFQMNKMERIYERLMKK